jgi:hypothetical protein
MAPTEFEALGGRGSARKWKESVKVGPDIPEYQGKPIGSYLREQLGVGNRFSLHYPATTSLHRTVHYQHRPVAMHTK